MAPKHTKRQGNSSLTWLIACQLQKSLMRLEKAGGPYRESCRTGERWKSQILEADPRVLNYVDLT